MLCAQAFLLFLVLLRFESFKSESLQVNETKCRTTSAKYYQVSSSWTLIYLNFHRITQLSLQCDGEDLVKLFDSNKYRLAFDFSSLSYINETVDLNAFSNSSDLQVITFYNIHGFDLNMKEPLITLDQSNPWTRQILVAISLSRFDFLHQGSLIESCDADVFEASGVGPFSGMQNTEIYIEMQNNYFKKPICPYVFKNASLREIRIGSYENDLLVSNFIIFQEIINRRNLTISLNASFQYVILEKMFNAYIDSVSLNHLVFGSVMFLRLDGRLLGIQDDLFKNYNNLMWIRVCLSNLREFFHASFNRWLEHLFNQGSNYSNKTEMSDHLRETQDKSQVYNIKFYDMLNAYDFPNEDFCLFRHYPAKKAIITVMIYESREANLNKSCTFKFLAQNNALISAAFEPHLDQEFYFQTFDQLELDACEFEQRVKACFNMSKRPQNEKTYFSYYDLLYPFKWMEFIGPVTTFPFFAGLAFVLNLFVVLIITSRKCKSEKLFEAKMFKYILMNSSFNCLECLVYQLKLPGICIGVNSIYCSSVKLSKEIYYSGIVVSYLSETFKSCSITTGLFFSLQRYAETSHTKNKYIKKLCKLQVKNVLVFVVVFSLLVSISKLSEFELENADTSIYDSPSSFYLSVYYFDSQRFKTVFYFMHYILNDLVILALNLFVDFLLVLEIKLDLKKKMQIRTDEMKTQSSVSQHDKLKLKEEEKKKTSVENKANAMIVVSLFVYFFCRLPELLGMIYFYYSNLGGRERTCGVTIFCYLVSNTIEYMYMLSYLVNIYIYYKFNNHFKKGFRIFFGLKP